MSCNPTARQLVNEDERSARAMGHWQRRSAFEGGKYAEPLLTVRIIGLYSRVTESKSLHFRKAELCSSHCRYLPLSLLCLRRLHTRARRMSRLTCARRDCVDSTERSSSLPGLPDLEQRTPAVDLTSPVRRVQIPKRARADSPESFLTLTGKEVELPHSCQTQSANFQAPRHNFNSPRQ